MTNTPPDEAAAPTGPTAGGALRAVLRDTALASLFAGGLIVVGLTVAVLLAPENPNLRSPWQPGMIEIAWELKIPSAEDPEALALLRRSARAEPRAGFLLQEADGSVWLAGVFERGAEGPPFDVSILGSHGTQRVRTSSSLAAAVMRTLSDPARRFDAAALLLPWFLLATSIAFLILGWWCRRRTESDPWPTSDLSRGGAVLRGVVVGLLSVAALAALDAILRKGGWDQKEQPLVLNMAKQGALVVGVFVFAAVVLAPLAEEWFFRGYVFRHLLVHGDARTAYVVSALLFAAAHGNLSALPSYLAYAMILGWSYEKWRTLWVPVVAHGVANAITVAVMLAA